MMTALTASATSISFGLILQITLLALLSGHQSSSAFVVVNIVSPPPPPPCRQQHQNRHYLPSSSSRRRPRGDSTIVISRNTKRRNSDNTAIHALLDVPDHFFAFTFPALGILLSISKGFARLRMEERAWEQRLEEARERRMAEDPTISELELRKQEAALEWSAYGKPRLDEEKRQQRQRQQRQMNSKRSNDERPMGDADESIYDDDDGRGQSRDRRRGRRVRVMERDEDDDAATFAESDTRRSPYMTDEEINRFEVEYNVEYDPYYDDPYTEDELPDDVPFQVDRKYGDRTYENGEIFYKDKASGLYYRQGAKPRSDFSFW